MEALFRHVSLSITAAGCKNRCKHCSENAIVSDPVLIPYEQVQKAVALVCAENDRKAPLYAEINPCLFLEPMDHPDVVRIQVLLHDLNPTAPLVRTIATNGQRIAADPDYERLIHGLQECGLEKFQLTLHGLERTHDRFVARRGAYSSLLEAARRVASVGVRVDWVFFLTKNNVGEFAEMILSARAAALGSESINIWGPAGRAGRHARLLATAEDLERLPSEIRAMSMLPEYRPESDWVEDARTWRMGPALRRFRESARVLGGIPDGRIGITRDNIADLPKTLDELRGRASRQPETPPASDPSDSEILCLVEAYGDPESRVLYRISTMYQEWRRRQRELIGRVKRDSNARATKHKE